MTYTTVTELMHDLQNYDVFIKAHRELNVPINYEIEASSCTFIVKAYDFTLKYRCPHDNLLEAMLYISNATNNHLDCGCTFTIS